MNSNHHIDEFLPVNQDHGKENHHSSIVGKGQRHCTEISVVLAQCSVTDLNWKQRDLGDVQAQSHSAGLSQGKVE